jgi:hypothetical protein
MPRATRRRCRRWRTRRWPSRPRSRSPRRAGHRAAGGAGQPALLRRGRWPLLAALRAALRRWATACRSPARPPRWARRCWRAGATTWPGARMPPQLPALQALLDSAPVWLLGPGREHWEALQGMGLRQLADLRSCRAPAWRGVSAKPARRPGPCARHPPDPRTWLTLPERFDSRLELARADHAEQVLHGARAAGAAGGLGDQARQARVAAFTLRMHHEARHRPTRARRAPPSCASNWPSRRSTPSTCNCCCASGWRACQLAAPTLELQLHCHELVQQAAPNGELFPTRQSERAGLVRLLERLRARLGDEQVQRLQPWPTTGPNGAAAASPRCRARHSRPRRAARPRHALRCQCRQPPPPCHSPARCGCCPTRCRWPNRPNCRSSTAGRCSCCPAPNASRPAGGTAHWPRATISSHWRPMGRWCGSTAPGCGIAGRSGNGVARQRLIDSPSTTSANVNVVPQTNGPPAASCCSRIATCRCQPATLAAIAAGSVCCGLCRTSAMKA